MSTLDKSSDQAKASTEGVGEAIEAGINAFQDTVIDSTASIAEQAGAFAAKALDALSAAGSAAVSTAEKMTGIDLNGDGTVG